MRTIDDVQVANLATGETWRTHEIAEEHAGRIAVLVGSHPPSLSFFGPDDRFIVRGRIAGSIFESEPLLLDDSQSEEDVEFVFTSSARGASGPDD